MAVYKAGKADHAQVADEKKTGGTTDQFATRF